MAVKKSKPKTCRICKNLFVPISSLSATCSVPCALKDQDAKRLKKLEQESKQNRQAVIELRKNTISWQHKQTQRVFNRMRVLEEFKLFSDNGVEPHCISCGKTKMDWCCGHYVPVGNNSSSLRYDPINTYLQCNTYCNSMLSGNKEGTKTTIGYTEGLLRRFGNKEGTERILHCKTDHKKIWACEELEAIRAGFALRIKELEKLGYG